MPLDLDVLHYLTNGMPDETWHFIVNKALEITSKPLAKENAPSEITNRDREIGNLDQFLSTSGWDLTQGETVQDEHRFCAIRLSPPSDQPD